jgi:hypothetical protein
MRTSSGTLETGRTAFARHAWQQAFTHLCEADANSPLDPADLERLAMAAYLLARDAEATSAMIRAHQGFLNQGDTIRAARCALWLSFGRTEAERARASGWLAKARRLLDEGQHDRVERGYLPLPVALGRSAAATSLPRTTRSSKRTASAIASASSFSSAWRDKAAAGC